MRDAPDGQISLTDPDARSMATSDRGAGMVGDNVQIAVDTQHHLIVTDEVTNESISKRGQPNHIPGSSGSARRSRLNP